MTKQDINQLQATTAAMVILESATSVLGDIVDELDSDVMNAVYEVRESIGEALDVIEDYKKRIVPVLLAACDEEESKC